MFFYQAPKARRIAATILSGKAVARVAQVPAAMVTGGAVAAPAAGAVCCPHLCNGDHEAMGGQTTRSPPVKNRFFAETVTVSAPPRLNRRPTAP